MAPTQVQAHDRPNDAGGGIIITWSPAADEPTLDGYCIQRATGDSTWESIGSVMRGVTRFEDDKAGIAIAYRYRVIGMCGDSTFASASTAAVCASPQFFHSGRVNVLVCVAIFAVTLLLCLARARSGKHFFIRRIPGLEAVEEAVGRATEMGRPILYVPGLGDIDWTSTIASMNILGEVAKKIVNYDAPLIVVNRWSIVYSVAKEIVREAYVSAGRLDRFREEYVRYLTEDQFGFAAAIDGIILREKPATNFFIGRFWAESLIIAETGAQSGSLQIAGTDAVNQLPFFVCACDYTLIGEELYAASAYLSREPVLLGSLKTQDYGKVLVIAVLAVFSTLAFLGLDLLPLLRVE